MYFPEEFAIYVAHQIFYFPQVDLDTFLIPLADIFRFNISRHFASRINLDLGIIDICTVKRICRRQTDAVTLKDLYCVV